MDRVLFGEESEEEEVGPAPAPAAPHRRAEPQVSPNKEAVAEEEEEEEEKEAAIPPPKVEPGLVRAAFAAMEAHLLRYVASQEAGPPAGAGKKDPRAAKPIATSAEREAARRAELNRKKRPVPLPKDALQRLSPTASGTKENRFAEGRRVAVLSPGKVRLAKQVADNTGMGRIAAPVAARAPSVITSRGVQAVAVSGPAGDSGIPRRDVLAAKGQSPLSKRGNWNRKFMERYGLQKYSKNLFAG